ncbi:MAG: sulfurtransferase [Betaproteobacteria bacterium RBG_16_64_18]|nr:MAG: sulfurtransferase [Betaproteobacteria bacterium RBG_16_64_18]OGA34656.1 MAG: sulfurtransferase [Betaproteobacteria bacterium RIFCSPLOWO2_12_61_14]
MTTENAVRVFAGIFILVSLGLGVEASPLFHSQHWLWFTAFVGANLLQSGFTHFCPLEKILQRLGLRSGSVAPGV